MKKETQIDRSAQGKNEVIMTDIPKSGFNLTYNNYFGGLVLGRLIPMAFQWLMPNDKFSGSNQHQITFEQLATPVLSDVNVSMHNFYCTLRAVDKDLPALLTPTKLNNMSANGSTPRFNVASVMSSIFQVYFSSGIDFITKVSNGIIKPIDTVSTSLHVFTGYGNQPPLKLSADLAKSYADDVVDDLVTKLDIYLNMWKNAANSTACEEAFSLFYTTIVDFFCGQGSLLDYFGYPLINHAMCKEICHRLYTGWNTYMAVGDDSPFIVTSEEIPLSAPLVNEYPLRIMFTIWTEYYRNFDVEPLTNDFPDYHTWGATPLPLDTLVQLLVTRPRSWSADPYISAGIDDISRHVFAPILQDNLSVGGVEPTASPYSLDTAPFSDKWDSLNVSYTSLDGSSKSVCVPLPSGIFSAFVTSSDGVDSYGLELNTLRKAHMIEGYLKRMYYGGDEYRDRCLNIWGSRIEDYRINRPELLSSSFDSVAVRQEVANTGSVPSADGTPNGQVAQGSRMATATANTEGSDGFTSFSPEFGMYIGVMSVMPRAQYDPMCMQLAMAKTFDFPAPQFANSMEETIQTIEMARTFDSSNGLEFALPFGFAPYAHAWRSRVDSVHGQYLDEKYDYSFARFWRANDAMNVPKLNHYFLHCHPRLDMFVDTVLLNGQMYGVGKHNFLVERVLPTPVEII